MRQGVMRAAILGKSLARINQVAESDQAKGNQEGEGEEGVAGHRLPTYDHSSREA